MKTVCLLVRSYNRPEYLKSTLLSLLNSDIDLCSARIIYDDGSTNKDTLDILHDPQYVDKFQVVFGNKNLGCKQSYVKALDHVSDEYDYVCVVDNDVNVKPAFITTLCNVYTDAYNVYKHKNILLTGFNPSNAHNNCIEKFPTFYRKKSCGGIHYFFDNSFKRYIQKQWSINSDHTVGSAMIRDHYPLLCLNKGVVQHIGEYGLHSSGNRCDTDSSF